MTLEKLYNDFIRAINEGGIVMITPYMESRTELTGVPPYLTKTARIHLDDRLFFIAVYCLDDCIYLDYYEQDQEHFSCNSKGVDEKDLYMLEFIYNHIFFIVNL